MESSTFMGGTALRVFDPVFLKFVYQQILIMYHLNHKAPPVFPGPFPSATLKFEPLDELKTRGSHYVACPLPQQDRALRMYVMFFTRKTEHYCACVDAALTVHLLHDVKAPRFIYRGTLMDGYAVPSSSSSSGGLHFMATDLVYSSSYSLVNYGLLDRMKVCSELVPQIQSAPFFDICLMPYVRARDLTRLLEQITLLDFACSAVLFIANKCPVKVGEHPMSFVLTPEQLQT